MEKGKSCKNLREKMLFLMCLGTLAGNISTEIYAQENLENNIKDYSVLIEETVSEIFKKTPDEDKMDIEVNISENGNAPIEVEKILITPGQTPAGFKTKINLGIDNIVKVNNSIESTIDVNNDVSTTELKVNFNNDVSITKDRTILDYFNPNLEKKYALYGNVSTGSSAGATVSIIVGAKNNTSKIQIIGDLGVQNEGTMGVGITEDEYNSMYSSTIELNLNKKESFFAGKMLSTGVSSSKYTEGAKKISLNLKNGATWYAHNSNGIDSYNISGEVKDALNGNLKTLITSNGGVIDIYHYSPNKTYADITSKQIEELKSLEEYILEEINKNIPDKESEEYKKAIKELEENIKIMEQKILEENKRELGGRTFTLNGVGDRLQNTTFRISTDVENKKSDKIVLNGVEVKKDSETYFIEIAADPFKSGEWKADKDDKILVMDINGNGLDKITVEGKECEAEIGAGLVKQKIIPTVEEDTANKGDWYLTSIDKIESKGSGHIFAEIGAAASAGMASAWRTDSGDLYQRMGNLRNNEAEQGVWGRIYTGENEIHKGIGLDLEYRAVQVGYDRKQNIDGGKLFTGIAFGYFDGNADYDHGSGESNSATVGMYATYSGNNGSFGDFIVKLGNIDNKLSYTSESGDYYKADYDTYGFSADAEYGYRYELNNDYYIEPLAQLSYIYIADEEYTMNLNGESGAKVSNDDYQSLIGYAGFHYGKKFGDNVAYLRVVAAHEFAGDIDVDARYQDIKVNSSISGEDTWVEYGVGFDVKVKEDTAVYGRLQKSTGDVVKNKWHASVGIRYTF